MDSFTKAQRSRCMAAVKSCGNKSTELKFIAILRANGIKGWRCNRPLPGKPDFVFYKKRVTVFVDGCFWHGCPKHCRMPSNNAIYWMNKIARNLANDRKWTKKLKNSNWKVMRIWEHELGNPRRVATRLFRLLPKSVSK